MPAENTEEMNGKRPFEQRVFARFDALDSAMRDTDSRLQKLEIRANDTKPIGNRLLKRVFKPGANSPNVWIASRLSPTKRELIYETPKIVLMR
ncbi:MAG: hypothetical protein ABR557_05185 [Pyrinomonadaceae bacterium]